MPGAGAIHSINGGFPWRTPGTTGLLRCPREAPRGFPPAGRGIPTITDRDRWHDWVERFNAEGPAGLIGRKPPGNRPKLDDAQRAALVRVVESGPNPVRDGVVRWRLIDLAAWVRDKFGISVSAATLSRELNALGFGKLSARPRHYAQNAEEIAAFEKTSTKLQ
jgi:transposase